MKKFLPTLFVIYLCCASIFAQFPNPILLNTASNAAGNGTLPVFTNDLNWTVSMTGTAGPWVAAVSAGNPYPQNWMVSPFPNANWISYPHTCPPVFSWPNSPAEHSCLNPGYLEIYYRLIVNLPAANCSQAITTPSAYCLSFDFFADNSVYEIMVNGNTSYLNPTSNPYYDLDYDQWNIKTVSLCDYWVPGNNTIIVHVKSGAGTAPTWEGLLAQVNQTVNTTFGMPGLSLTTSVTNATCMNTTSGSATVNATGIGPFSYSWQPGGGNGPSATNLAPGIYTVTVSNGNACVTSRTLAVLQGQTFPIGATGPEPRCAGSQLTLTATGANTYTWLPGNFSGSTIVVSPTATTVYTVTGTNSVGCKSTKTYTQNTLGCVGINESKTSIVIFNIIPNPSDGIFRIEGILPDDHIKIIDHTGRIMQSFRCESITRDMDLSEFQTGLYFIKITRDGNSSIKRLLLSK